MIDEPVQKRSAMSMKPTRGLIQMISSSAMRETCIISTEAAAQNSMAKSRSETASSELWHTSSKPSVCATRRRSIGKVVPASAAAPSGRRLTRLRVSSMRSTSRPNIST